MQMTRRQALAWLAGAGPCAARSGREHALAEAEPRLRAAPPEALRAGWSVFPLGPGERRGAALHWREGAAGPSRLRLTVAFDARENLRVIARTRKTRAELGFFDIRFAYPFQPFDLALSARQAELASAEGVELVMSRGEGPLWVFADAPAEAREWVAPQLRREAGAGLADFERALESAGSAQPFGWMEGCVMDGLEQRRARLGLEGSGGALAAHLGMYFDSGQTPRVAPHLETPARHGTEGLLPFAVLAKHDAAHPSFAGMLAFCERAAAERGGILRDGAMTTAEGCYTLAYPLAALGRARGERRLRELAVRQLLDRIELLPHGGALYLRASEDGTRTFRNWARGVAWFALGIVRTLEELPAEEIPAKAREAFVWCAGLALRWQSPQGLWHCFLDDPATGVETSGSAGIAAALACGARWLREPEKALRAARAAHAELLRRHLVAGGLLGGVSQANRDGERLQRGGYRVIGQFGMGLLAQLDAALRGAG
ncbi:MAG: glycoside hydrolase family 88 protein [Bryobacteraceae bacterium]|nr:glycoside hydrolase family 88 protein [Bryobacteraceae bacterium]